MEGAKDPDEFVIKYGNGRFNLLVENAISLVEFKVKVLKNSLNLEHVNDKIKAYIVDIRKNANKMFKVERPSSNIMEFYKSSLEVSFFLSF